MSTRQEVLGRLDSGPHTIFILKPSSLGDVIQALPVLRLLKLRFPSCRIYWWVATQLSPLLAEDPDLDGLVPFDRQAWHSPRGWATLVASCWRVHQTRMDWVIDLQGLLRSGLFSWLARGRLTIGVDDPREGAGAFYDLRVPRPSFHTHAVDWYLQVLVRLGVPVHGNFAWLPVNPKAQARLEQKWHPSSNPWIALNPGARWPNKRWPAEHFATLARQLCADIPALKIAILGGPSDRALAQHITDACPDHCLNLAGQTDLGEMVEWIRRCRLIVTNDTGPMHVAAALKTPVVALFGPTHPNRTGPYGQLPGVIQTSLPCVPCMKATCANEKKFACLQSLPPSLVAQRVWHRLAESEPTTSTGAPGKPTPS